MRSFSKSERSNHPGRLAALVFCAGFVVFAAYRIATDRADLADWIVGGLFFLGGAVVVRGFTHPHVISFHADESGLSISHSRRGALFALPWSGVHKLELDAHDGLYLYAEDHAGRRHKLNQWVSFTEEEAIALLRFVSGVAPQVKTIEPNQPLQTTRAFGPRV